MKPPDITIWEVFILTENWPSNDTTRRKALEIIEQWIEMEEEKILKQNITEEPKKDESK